MNKKVIFKGSATALVTPFNSEGNIDFISFGKMIDRQIEANTNALVVCGTTGESATLSDDERRMLISFAVSYTHGRIPVISGTGSNNGKYAIELSRFAASEGVDGILVVTPYYNKTSENGLIKYFLDIADNVDIPIILYNVPSRTGCSITLPVYRKLSKHENIVGVKEASGNISTAVQIVSELSESLALYSGCDDITLPLLSLGGYGVISVISNIMPYEVHYMCQSYFNGNPAHALEIQLRLVPLINALFSEVNPIPIKTACAELELCSDIVRSPLCEMDIEKKKLLLNLLREYGLTK